MPICIPTCHIHLSLGRRIGNENQRWSLDDVELNDKICSVVTTDALGFLETVSTPSRAALVAMRTDKQSGSLKGQQACAYLHARAGEYELALQALSKFIKSLDPAIAWQAEMLSRARHLFCLLRKARSASKHSSVLGRTKRFGTWDSLNLRKRKHPKQCQNNNYRNTVTGVMPHFCSKATTPPSLR